MCAQLASSRARSSSTCLLSGQLNGRNSGPSLIKVPGKINNRFINVFLLNFLALREDLNKQDKLAFIEEEDRVMGVFVYQQCSSALSHSYQISAISLIALELKSEWLTAQTPFQQ